MLSAVYTNYDKPKLQFQLAASSNALAWSKFIRLEF